MNAYEQLRALEEYLSGEARMFRDEERIAADKGMSKAVFYCVGCRLTYENVRDRVRAMVRGN